MGFRRENFSFLEVLINLLTTSEDVQYSEGIETNLSDIIFTYFLLFIELFKF